MTKVTLYSGTRNASSWAMRAWLALRAAELPFEEVIVDIRRPQRYPNLHRLRGLSPSATVPLLVVDDTPIFDSMAIMEYANEYVRGRLLPQDGKARATARAIMAWQHAGLSRICWRMSFESAFYPWKRPLSVEEQEEVGRLCAFIEPLLVASGGPFLFGSVSLADFSLAPAVIRLLRHVPDLTAWPATRAWMVETLSHPLVAEWVGEADQLPPVWQDDYLPDDRQYDWRADPTGT